MSKITVTGQITLTGGQLIAKETPIPLVVGPELWSWGKNLTGNLGLGDTNDRSSPVQIGNLTTWSSFSLAQVNHAIKTDGTLWAWGASYFGHLGDGTSSGNNKSSPIQIGALTDWASVNTGINNSHAIKTNGELWGWGNGASGRLGDGTAINKSSPVQIGSLTDWTSLAVGAAHSLAIKTNGELWAWGYAGTGRLGDGTSSGNNKSSPIQIGNLTTWASVNAGKHSLAIKTDGTLWAWGRNNLGGLGDGTKIDRSSPVQVGSLTDWASASAGYEHSLAVKTDGTLWAWGSNGQGRLGDGTTTTRSSPVQIGGLTDWASISGNKSSSNAFTFARKTDGTIWSWGKNTQGRLAQEDTIDRSSPVQVGSETNWTSVAAGSYSSLAIKTTT